MGFDKSTDRVDGRDAYLDLVRSSAIVLVVVGHWLLSAVSYDHGRFYAEESIVGVSFGPWLTWLFQVVPLFFLVGGYVNALSWSRRAAVGETWTTWVRVRLRRLLAPTTTYVGVVVLGLVVCIVARLAPDNRALAGWGLSFHLWFLAVYVVVLLVTPLVHHLYERLGIGLPLVTAGLAVLFGVGTVAGHWPLVGWANYLLVWGLFFQLGFFWRGGYFDRLPLVPPGLAVVAIGALAMLIGFAGYPVSMIGFPGAKIQNPSPPSVALLAFGVAQCCVVISLASPARRVLRRLRVAQVFKGIRLVSTLTMLIYLWHMVPVIVVAVIVYPTGLFSQPAVGSDAWWLQRGSWIGALGVVLVGVVGLAAAVASAWRRHRARASAASDIPARAGGELSVGLRLLTGVALVSASLAHLALHGVAPTGRIDVASLTGLGIGSLLCTVEGLGSVHPRVPNRQKSARAAAA